MKKTRTVALMFAAFIAAVVPLLPQTPSASKLSFDVVSIKPSTPGPGMRGGGARGNRYTMNGATLKMLLQTAYQRPSSGGPTTQLQVVGGPGWIDSDRY